MNLTYAKTGITREVSRFGFVGRVRMTVILAYSCLLTCLFLKEMRGFFNELSHENLFVFIFSGWIYLLCESNWGEEIK